MHSICLGYRGVTANFTYSWKPVNNTNFAVCIVVASNELDTTVKPVYLQLAIKLVSEISSGRKICFSLSCICAFRGDQTRVCFSEILNWVLFGVSSVDSAYIYRVVTTHGLKTFRLALSFSLSNSSTYVS